ncbi:MAG: aminoacyl-tRNA hydrolase [Lacibacter sp.]|jgi:PTH1 family peptidyl-tRNA hydrolase
MKYLIVGLGNIGAEYAHTRHNIGFDVVEALVQKHGGSFSRQRLGALAHITLKGRHLICLQPDTYMNLSGKAVKYWLDKEGIALQHLLVVLDDLALPLTKLRLRPGGSHAGHNGLRSIEEHLHTNQYPRLRFGIGNDYPKGRQADFVLSRWKPEEEPLVQLKINHAVTAIEDFVLQGIERAMNKVNNTEITLP